MPHLVGDSRKKQRVLREAFILRSPNVEPHALALQMKEAELYSHKTNTGDIAVTIQNFRNWNRYNDNR